MAPLDKERLFFVMLCTAICKSQQPDVKLTFWSKLYLQPLNFSLDTILPNWSFFYTCEPSTIKEICIVNLKRITCYFKTVNPFAPYDMIRIAVNRLTTASIGYINERQSSNSIDNRDASLWVYCVK